LLQAATVNDIYNSWCTKLQAAFSAAGAKDGVVLDESATGVDKIRYFLAKTANVGNGAIFVPVCQGIMPLIVKAKTGEAEKPSNSQLTQVKNLISCPGFACTNLLTVFAAVAGKIPGVGGILKTVLTTADNVLFTIYKSNPMMVNLCASSLGQVYSKPFVVKGKTLPPLWTGTDPMACVPEAAKKALNERLGLAEPTPVSEEDLADLM
jgi:hypothetical protein